MWAVQLPTSSCCVVIKSIATLFSCRLRHPTPFFLTYRHPGYPRFPFTPLSAGAAGNSWGEGWVSQFLAVLDRRLLHLSHNLERRSTWVLWYCLHLHSPRHYDRTGSSSRFSAELWLSGTQFYWLTDIVFSTTSISEDCSSRPHSFFREELRNSSTFFWLTHLSTHFL